MRKAGLTAILLLTSTASKAAPSAFIHAPNSPRQPLPRGELLRPTTMALSRSTTSPSGATSYLGYLPQKPLAALAGLSKEARRGAMAKFFLQRNLSAADLSLTHAGAQTVDDETTSYFAQTVDEVPVEGAYALTVTRGEALRYIRHYLVQPPQVDTQARLSAGDAELAALREAATQARVAQLQAGKRTKLRIVYVADKPHLAYRVHVSLKRPWEARAYFVDAQDGAVLTFRKTSFDAVSGQLRFKAEKECNGDKPEWVDMPHTLWHRNKPRYTHADGSFSASNNLKKARVALRSPYVRLHNERGPDAGPWRFDLAPAPAENELQIDDAPLDEVDPFLHVHTVRAWLHNHVEGDNEQIKWSNDELRVNVNVQDSCNAYYDGSLNFFDEGDGCMNTGRTADVVYHEYGHGIHEHSPAHEADLHMDGQVSEGIADYIAVSITGNPNIRGLYACDDNFRSCVNELTYCERGCDMSDYTEVHDAGQVICAVWWEFRELMIKRYGQRRGVDTADRIFLKSLTLIGDMYSAYGAAIAADDDKDHDPTNGTKHSCEINRAFANTRKGSRAHFPKLEDKIPCHKKRRPQ